MNSVLFCVVFSVSFGWSIAQVPDYETTSQPLPHTSFTCQGRPPGYYADVETGCRTYHVCDGNSHFTYICPRRTLFQQKMRICDHSYLVNCDESYLYDEDDYYPGEVGEEEDNQLKENVEVQPIEENTTQEPVTVIITPRPKLTTITEIPPTSVATTSRPTETTKLQTATTEILQPTSKKYLKLHLKDLRSLFYIPEIDDNSIARTPIAEYLLPVETEMRFKTRGVSNVSSSCPKYCNPKFFVPGTCHPCIMLK